MNDAGVAAAHAPGLGVLRLVALKGASAGDRYETADMPRRVTIGRRPTNDLVLRDETVSREHAVVEPTPDGWRITACKRGALLMRGGQVVPEEGVLLVDGDELQLGRAVLAVGIVVAASDDDADRTVVLQPPPAPPHAAVPPAFSAGDASGETPHGDDASCPDVAVERDPRERFGRFDVFGAIHDGDECRVDRAVEVATGRPVTLRRLRAPQLGFFARRRFLRAAGRLQRLEHPNLLAPQEIGRAGSDLVMAYPPFDGVAADVLLRHGRRDLPIDLAVWIAREVARGLAHGEQVLGPEVRLAISDGDVLCDRTGGVALLLSPVGPAMDRYRAPEEDAGGGGDVRAAVFALGVLLWELLARETVAAGQQATLRSIDAVRIQVAPPLAAVVMRALEVRPQDRFGRAEDLADALAEELDRIAPAYDPEAVVRWLREHVPDEEGER